MPAPVVPITGPLLEGAYKTAARVFRARTVHCSHPYIALGGPRGVKTARVLPKVQYNSVRTFPMIQQGPSDIPSFHPWLMHGPYIPEKTMAADAT